MGFTEHQQKAIDRDMGNTIVSASAGSGKTAVVIERIIRLITKEGASVNKLLAVTFTNLAASEMKEKLKTAIINEINKDDVLEENKIRLKRELDDVNGADISTIHSFCLNVLRKYFYALELDATFDICDETKSKKLKAKAMDNAFEKLYEEKAPEFLTALDVFARGRNDSKLRTTVEKFALFVESETDVSVVTQKTLNSTQGIIEFLDGYLKNYYQKRLRFTYEKLLKIKPFFVGVDHREEQIKLLEQKFNTALEADTYQDLVSALREPKIEKKKSKTEEDKILKKYHDDFEELAFEIVSNCNMSNDEALALSKNVFEEYKSLEYVYNKYNEEYSALKREENIVDFCDLEHFTYKLFQNADILQEIKDKYDYIFIDEYQDVNGVQEELVKLLSKNNEFMVGDLKQSIYAFRGSNPQSFKEKDDVYKLGYNDTKSISLDKNFRSAKKVVETVNSVFSRIMTEDFGGYNYADNKMEYGGLYENEETNISYEGATYIDVLEDDLEVEENKLQDGVYSVKEADLRLKNANDGANEKLVLKLVKEAVGKTYYDIKSKSEKTIDYGDIVILMRSLGDLGDNIVNCLVKEGIPVSAESKDSIGNYPEIKTLVNFIKLLTCAEQDIPLANTLLELWNVTEEELAKIRAYGDSNGSNLTNQVEFSKTATSVKNIANLKWDSSFYDCAKAYSKTQTELGYKLNDFFNYIEKIRIILEFTTASELVTRVISETGYDNKILSSNYGELKMRRIDRFISAMGSSSVFDFASSIDEILEEITVSEASGENTVRVMTMHASKGLEFPYVIIAGTDKKFNFKDGEGFFIKDRKHGVSLQSINREDKLIRKNPHYCALSKFIKEQAVFEEMRVFYVALTRAKYELHIVVNAENLMGEKKYIGNANCQTHFLNSDDAQTRFHRESELVLGEKSVSEKVAGNEISSKLASLIKRNLSLTYGYEKDTALPVKSSVSKINECNLDEHYETVDIFGESSAEKGTAYHKALELINFYGNVDSEFKVLCDNGVFSQEELNVLSVEKLKNILKLEVFEEIKGYKLYKELKFYNLVKPEKINLEGNDSEILVQGIIDLLAVKDNQAVLIDYKLSTIANDGDLVRKYKKQMELYAMAIENSLKIKVEKIYLVNILQEKSIEISRLI